MISHCFSTTFNAFPTLYPLSSEIVPLFTGPNWQFRSAPGQDVLVTSKGIVRLTFVSTVQMQQDAMTASTSISIRHTASTRSVQHAKSGSAMRNSNRSLSTKWMALLTAPGRNTVTPAHNRQEKSKLMRSVLQCVLLTHAQSGSHGMSTASLPWNQKGQSRGLWWK